MQLKRIPECIWVWLTATIGSLAFLLLGPYSNYGPAGYLDPWFYTGYFLHFSYLVRHLGPTYYVGRLPWILPGLGAFHFFPPEVANVVLNLAIVVVSAVALYWAVRWYYGVGAGVAAAALLVANPYFISCVAWDYPDGPAIAYALVAIVFAVRPYGIRTRNSAITGCFLALAGLTNMSAAPVILGVAAMLLVPRRPARDLLRDYIACGLGAGIVVLALCPISQILFGRWTYFYWQVYQTIATFGNKGFLDRMWGTGPGFLTKAYRLASPLALLGLALITMRRSSESKPHLRLAAFGSLLLALVLYTVQDFVFHGAALRVPYHSSYIVAPLFFCVGILLGEVGISRKHGFGLALLAVTLPFGFHYFTWSRFAWQLLIVLSLLTAIMFLLRRARIAAPLLAALVFLSPALDAGSSVAWDNPRQPDGRNIEVFRHLLVFEKGMQSSVDPSRWVRFWHDGDEPVAAFYNSAESLYLWMVVDFSHELASWPESRLRKEIPARATIVHLTVDPSRIAARSQALAARGIRIVGERRWTMPYAGYTIHVVLQDVDR
jgi:hypothetical protein